MKYTCLIQIPSTGMLLTYAKGHGSSDIQGLIFQNFPAGSPFCVVIASGWHQQKHLRLCFLMGKLLMFLKWNRFQIFLDATWAQLWIVKPLLYAWEDASAQFILDICKDWTISSCGFYAWSWGPVTSFMFWGSGWVAQGVCLGRAETLATLPRFTVFSLLIPEDSNFIVLFIIL